MRNLIFDIETTPLAEERLLALMPPEMANPVMPQELVDVPIVDTTGCPKYGGDTEKQEAWKKEQVSKVMSKWNQAREDWQMKATDAKAKFIADAALHAERGQLKVMSFRDGDVTTCHVMDASKEERAKIEAKKDWPCRVQFIFSSEKAGLALFHQKTQEIGTAFKARLVGYYIIGFDLPFLMRREMIVGEKVSRGLMRTSRYFDEEFYVDLHEAWTMGDKQVHTGGLAGLSKILGVKEKQGSGEGFFRLWRDDVIAALLYHLEELSVIEQCAKKMGV
jgi:hypothetical protein